MSIYHFKTNINSPDSVRQIELHLNRFENNQSIVRWQMNANDPEYLLEIETNKLSPAEVKHLLREAGFEAEFTRAPEARKR